MAVEGFHVRAYYVSFKFYISSVNIISFFLSIILIFSSNFLNINIRTISQLFHRKNLKYYRERTFELALHHIVWVNAMNMYRNIFLRYTYVNM